MQQHMAPKKVYQLQIAGWKKSGSKWIRQCALETPSAGKNTFGYVREMDYSDDIGTGTYRIGATFDADGHSITRYSNSRTF